MSTINWANSVSGTWKTAANWVGGQVPGVNDTAVIGASGNYTVTINAAVDVAGVVLDDALGTLALESALVAPVFAFDAGTLLLGKKSSLSGTITEASGATVALAKSANATLNNVTWIGVLDPSFAAKKTQFLSTLTITNGLTLLAADGSSPGTANLASVTLNDVSVLNNAAIAITSTYGTVTVTNTPTLTLGTGLTLTGDLNNVTAGETIINDGVLRSDLAAASGNFVNNGSLTVAAVNSNDTVSAAGYINFGGASFTNDGHITVNAGAALVLQASAVQARGAGDGIILDGGTLGLVGSLTTAQVQALYSAQNITFTPGTAMAHGFEIEGTLNNAGATLDFGANSLLGVLNAGVQGGTITGGTVVDHSGSTTLGNSVGLFGTATVLQNLTVQSQNATLALSGISLNGDTVTGPGTVAIGGQTDVTFSATSFAGVSALMLSGNLVTLNGISFTGVAGSPVITSTDGLIIGTAQSIAGLTLNFSGNNGLQLDSSALYTDTTINASGGAFIKFAASGTVGFGAGANINVLAQSSLNLQTQESGTVIDNDGVITVEGAQNANPSGWNIAASLLDNAGTIMGTQGVLLVESSAKATLTNAGTISLLSVDVDGQLTNSGAIEVAGGTLTLTVGEVATTGIISATNAYVDVLGKTNLAGITAFLGSLSLTNATPLLGGTLDLGGKTVASGALGVSLGNGTITDGTLLVNAGTTFNQVTLHESYEWQGTFGVAVTNNGTIALGTASSDQATVATTTFADAVSGSGVISTYSATTIFDQGVSSGQTVQLAGTGAQNISFGSQAAATSFAGTLAGFKVGAVLEFLGQTVTDADFSGDSIQVTLSTHTTLSLATSTALTGSLGISGDEVYYKSTAASLHDFLPHGVVGAEPVPATAALGGGGGFALADVEWVMLHHGVAGFGH